MRRVTRTGVLRRAGIAVALAVVGLGCSVSSASAGTYVVDYCRDLRAAENWTVHVTAPGWGTGDCPGTGAMQAFMAGTGRWGEGSSAAFTFTAPDGLSIAGWHPRLHYDVTRTRGEQTDRLRLTVGPVPASSSPISCVDDSCPATIDQDIPLYPGTRSVEARTRCTNERSDYDGCYFETLLFDYGGTLTLSDDYLPTARTAATGTLVSATTPRLAVQGLAGVGMLVDDIGSGVARSELQIDGQVVATAANGCQPQPTSRVVPCPFSQQAELRFDSTRVSDGSHHAAVVVYDASGNQQLAWQGRVFVANQPIGPGSPAELRGATTGTGATDGAKITASWPTTRRRVPRACRRSSYRCRHRSRCRGRFASQTYKGNYSSSRTVTLTGRVTDRATKQPIAAAPVVIRGDVFRGPTAPWAIEARTDSTGRWTVRVPRNVGARQLTVGYRSHENDTVPAASTRASLIVRSRASLHARPRRARAGRRVRFSGRLADGTPGVPILVQALSRGRYRTFETVTTNGHGRFQVGYRLGRAFRGRYRFRAVVRPTKSTPYPYVRGTSNSVTIRVR